MIKVIASDLDGTLFGSESKIAPETLAAVKRACEAGIRFIITTGRNFRGVMKELEDADLTCDYILCSGAEVRNSKQEIVSQVPINMEQCREVYEVLQKYPVSVIFGADEYDYQIGTYEEVEKQTVSRLNSYFSEIGISELQKAQMFGERMDTTKVVKNFQELNNTGVPVYKLFLFSDDREMLAEIDKELAKQKQIAVSSSFPTNLEITDVRAQKGPVLKEYIESLGYQMEEVMTFGDSRNDESMLSMDFGATIAMANADEELKKVAKYITKSNVELGVAYVIEELLKQF
ncbi:MAG: HAD family phosphatase [Lachnospiraceae bacterium]|nr:HAD family phosphatase [Lachnospiraceae bacterium]MCI9018663.1 HAD family phosphatase [Lachnospiraceae bacterium]